MNAAGCRRIALSLEGAEEGSHLGAADFRVGGKIFATLASQRHGYGNVMLTPELQGICTGVTGSFPASAGWVGKNGNDPRPVSAGDRGSLGQRPADGVELRIDKNKKSAGAKSVRRD